MPMEKWFCSSQVEAEGLKPRWRRGQDSAGISSFSQTPACRPWGGTRAPQTPHTTLASAAAHPRRFHAAPRHRWAGSAAVPRRVRAEQVAIPPVPALLLPSADRAISMRVSFAFFPKRFMVAAFPLVPGSGRGADRWLRAGRPPHACALPAEAERHRGGGAAGAAPERARSSGPSGAVRRGGRAEDRGALLAVRDNPRNYAVCLRAGSVICVIWVQLSWLCPLPSCLCIHRSRMDLDAAQALLAQQYLKQPSVINTVTNPKFSPIKAAMKKLSS